MKAFLALSALLPLAAAAPNTGSYASFSHHGQSYGYNHDHGHSGAEPIYYHRKPEHPAPYKPKEPAYKPEPKPYKPEPEPYKPEPAPYKPHEPAYKPAPYKPSPYQAAPSYHGHHAPSYHKPAYGYEEPRHNCTVQDVTEPAEACTPAFETTCEDVELPIKRIVDGEYCYDVARTVCTESTETIDNEVCSYSYNKKYEDTTAKTVEVTFKKETDVQMVTVCQPNHGYGYHSYGHQYCKEVAQETAYNVPVVTPVDVDVRVGYPEPVKTCVNKPISLPRLSCEVITENKCVAQPEVEDDVEVVQKCTTSLAEPKCQNIELNLPKQVCKELVYGYAEEVPEHYSQ